MNMYTSYFPAEQTPILKPFQFKVFSNPEIVRQQLAPKVQEKHEEQQAAEEEVKKVEKVIKLLEAELEEKLNIAKEEGRLFGFQEGYVKALEEASSQNSALLKEQNEISSQLMIEMKKYNELIANHSRQFEKLSANLALEVIKHTYQAIDAEQLAKQINQVVGKIFPKLIKQPSLNVKLPANLSSEVEKIFTEAKERTGFSGEVNIEVVHNSEKTCQIYWPEGVVTVDFGEVEKQVLSQFKQYFTYPSNDVEFLPEVMVSGSGT